MQSNFKGRWAFMLERTLDNRVNRFFSDTKKGNNDRNDGRSERWVLLHENGRVIVVLFQSNLTGKGNYLLRWQFHMTIKTYSFWKAWPSNLFPNITINWV